MKIESIASATYKKIEALRYEPVQKPVVQKVEKGPEHPNLGKKIDIRV